MNKKIGALVLSLLSTAVMAFDHAYGTKTPLTKAWEDQEKLLARWQAADRLVNIIAEAYAPSRFTFVERSSPSTTGCAVLLGLQGTFINNDIGFSGHVFVHTPFGMVAGSTPEENKDPRPTFKGLMEAGTIQYGKEQFVSPKQFVTHRSERFVACYPITKISGVVQPAFDETVVSPCYNMATDEAFIRATRINLTRITAAISALAITEPPAARSVIGYR